MSALLPPSTNELYTGARGSVWFLRFMTLLTIIPACIHTFLPDGGAGVIAGLDLSQNGDLIVGVFAWAGTTQLVWGLLMLTVVTRYQNFVPLVLSLVLFERILHALNMWVLKGGGDGHHPPEAYITLLLVPLIAVAFRFSLVATSPSPVQ